MLEFDEGRGNHISHSYFADIHLLETKDDQKRVLQPSITDAKKKATPSHKALLQFSDKENWPVQYPVPEG